MESCTWKQVSVDDMWRHLRHLCEQIGTRFVGSEGERQATAFIADRLREVGLRHVDVEEFSLDSWDCTRAELKAGDTPVECLPVSYTASTPEGGAVAQWAYIGAGTKADLARHALKGKIGVLAGSVGGSHSPKAGEEMFQRLLASGMVGLVLIEDRCPTRWPRAEGIPPFWFRHGSMPMVSVSYEDGGRILRERPERLYLDVQASSVRAHSRNVIGEIRGRRRPEEVIVVSCHHDTVPGSAGACDNGTGVVAVLEMAKLLRDAGLNRTVRLISFGSEEQLSMGAAQYVEAHREEMERIVLAINFDGMGVFVGQGEVMVTGAPDLRTYVKRIVGKAKYAAEVKSGVSPFSDHFPFSMRGVPTVWFEGRRPNFFYHSREDVPERVDMAFVADSVRTALRLIADGDARPEMPFPREIPERQRRQIEKLMRQLYGIEV